MVKGQRHFHIYLKEFDDKLFLAIMIEFVLITGRKADDSGKQFPDTCLNPLPHNAAF